LAAKPNQGGAIKRRLQTNLQLSLPLRGAA
jgi:hypothetical protein